MCGRFNISDSPAVQQLLLRLGIDSHNWPVRFSDYHRACNTISIVRHDGQSTVLEDATWWLLLEFKDDRFKPSRYTSFNTRYDKLDVPRSAGYRPFRQSRCIIPASGFGETEYETINGKKKPMRYTNFSAKEAIAFGGLYRQWQHPLSGEIVNSCSIITLPPHPKLTPYHSKASPLMLPQEGPWLEQWLDPEIREVEQFTPLLQPAIRQSLEAQIINKPSERQAIGSSIGIQAD